MNLAGVACGGYLELWVGVEVGNDSGEFWLHSKACEGGDDGLCMDFVKGLLPAKDEKVKGVFDSLCLFHEAPDDVDWL